jgi:hypothetical protein
MTTKMVALGKSHFRGGRFDERVATFFVYILPAARFVHWPEMELTWAVQIEHAPRTSRQPKREVRIYKTYKKIDDGRDIAKQRSRGIEMGGLYGVRASSQGKASRDRKVGLASAI